MIEKLKKIIRKKLINFFRLGEIGVIDVGSAEALPPYWEKSPWKISHLLRFEPRESSKYGKNITALNKVLWSKKAMKNFYIYKGFGGSGSSLFKQNYKYVRDNFKELSKSGNQEINSTWFERSELVQVRKVKCVSLDMVLKNLKKKKKYHVLKIDAQGAEYEILKGAKNYLKNDCVALFLETFRKPLYVGIKLFSDIEKLLLEHDFYLTKKYPDQGSFNSQNDCLFVKKGGNERLIKIIKDVYEVN